MSNTRTVIVDGETLPLDDKTVSGKPGYMIKPGPTVAPQAGQSVPGSY